MFKGLTIAGSDSSAGAGIQADLKTFSALGVYASTVITAVTAQNTLGVFAIKEIDAAMVQAQLEAILSDVGTDAVKIGMLPSPEVTRVVADVLRRFKVGRIVMDPVICSTSGTDLANRPALETWVATLFPMVDLITPNIPEAERLTGITVRNVEQMETAAYQLWHCGARAVLVKGGHLADQATDVLYDGVAYHHFAGKRLVTSHTHGTGCTLSTAIAAYLARGDSLLEAIDRAKHYLSGALRHGLAIGQGNGPVDHFYRMRNHKEE